MVGNRQKTINVHALIKQGLSFEELEVMLTRFFTDNDSVIRDVDFVVDIAAVVNLVQPETDKILGNL